jgi:hypothetical protein
MTDKHTLEYHLHCVRIQLHSPGVKALTYEQFCSVVASINIASDCAGSGSEHYCGQTS